MPAIPTAAPSTISFTGSMYGGQQPVAGASIVLYAVGQTGDGSPATSLMTSPVTTTSRGNFTLTGNFTCPATTPTFPGQVYLVGIGGNPGNSGGQTNPNLVMIAALGLCSQLSASTFISLNEQTTVASVAALAPYISSYSAIGSGASDAAALGEAMTVVNQYVNVATGAVPGPALPSGYSVPSTALATLADALSSCVNSTGGVSGDKSACGNLFSYANTTGTPPTDTLTAIRNIFNSPLNNVANIFSLVPTSPPYNPPLSTAPSSWALPITATGNGTLTLASSAYTVNENGGSVSLLVTRTEGDSGAVTVAYSTANGTATAGTDYTATSGTLSWSAGDSSGKVISVPVTDAMVSGGTRTFTLSLSTPGGGAALGSITSATVTIDDTDVQTSFYVSPTGNDTTGTGTMSAPFATLAKAQAAMRASSTIKTTQIETGTYYLTTALALTSADSGETWQAAPGATPVISGGVAVTGWTSIGGGIYTAPLSSPAGVDLEIGGTRQYPAMLGFDPFRPFMTGWHVINYNATTTGQVMNVSPSDMSASAQTIGGILQYTDTSRYTDWFGTISAASYASGTITINGYRAAPSAGVWRVLGDYRDVTVPGQFGYNPTTKQLYVMPTSACGFGSGSVAVSAQLGSLITVSSVSNLTISGLTFSDTVSPRTQFTDYAGVYNTLPLGTIQGNALSNSSIINNKFVNVGNGISLTSSTGNSINGNSFDQLGAGAIFLKTQSNNNQIESNTMTSLGRINIGAQGIYIQNSANVTVASNYLNGVGRFGVSISIGDTTSTSGLNIANNVIINTSQQTNDTAAIYMYAGTNSTQVNISSTVTGNRVENSGGFLQSETGTATFAQNRAIYMDDKVSGVTINDNVTENNFQGILLCHGCTGNTANNNVAILNPQPVFANYQGTTSAATGAMALNGTTSINLLPSYFPASVTTSVIVVQMSGTTTGSTQPQFNVLADGNVIGSGSVPTDGNVHQFVYAANLYPRMMHQIGVQLTNGANTGSATQSLANMILFVNNTLINLAAVSEYGMQVLSDSSTNQPNVSNFSYNRNIVYRASGAGGDAQLYFEPHGYTDPDPGTIDYNLMYVNLVNAANTYPDSNSYLPTKSDAHALIADPQFLNLAIGDYTLSGSSPAYGLGFTASGVPLAPPALYPATAVSACTVY